MKIGMTLKVGAVAAVAVAGAVAVSGRTEAADETATAPEVAVAELSDLDVRAEAAGLVEPIRVIEVKSKASGEILTLHVETGDLVERGALLAEVDPRDVQNALEQAEADLEVARVRAETAETNRKRVEELRAANVVTQQEYESALQAAADGHASLVRARTNLQLARERRQDVTIRAPISGTIIAHDAEPGQIIASATSNVSGGTTLFTMADLSEMQVRTLVDETDIGQLRPGQPADVTVEAYPNRTFRGEVLKIEPQAVVEQNVTMFPVLIRLDNGESLLKPGMNAEVAVEIASRRGVLTVPNSAIVAVREAMSAASALGIDEETFQAAMMGARGGPPAAERAAAPAADAPTPPAPNGASEASSTAPDCTAMVQRVRAAGGPQGLAEADRAALVACRAQLGGAMGGRGMGGGRDGAGRAGGGPSDVRPGVVFVEGAGGPEPRRVLLGVNDWDNTEILQGLEPGERVILMSVARLQQQQEEFTNRIRERATASPFGGGGRRPGGGGAVRIGGGG